MTTLGAYTAFFEIKIILKFKSQKNCVHCNFLPDEKKTKNKKVEFGFDQGEPPLRILEDLAEKSGCRH